MILTPITGSASLAFMPSYRWDPQIRRATRRCRLALVQITRDIAQRYAQEQAIEAQDDVINRHWRQA